MSKNTQQARGLLGKFSTHRPFCFLTLQGIEVFKDGKL
jgi:hypothetical protein